MVTDLLELVRLEEQNDSPKREPFVHAESADRQLGHGLGLAICARLAKALGSQLQVESEIGRGSCFWVDLDLGRCHSSPSARPQPKRSVVVVAPFPPERPSFGELFGNLLIR